MLYNKLIVVHPESIFTLLRNVVNLPVELWWKGFIGVEERDYSVYKFGNFILMCFLQQYFLCEIKIACLLKSYFTWCFVYSE